MEQAKPDLVQLPRQILRHILVHAGVAQADGRPYTYRLDGPRDWSSFDFWSSFDLGSSLDPPPARDLAGLLLSCRALHRETAVVLYSANRFVIYYSRPGSLDRLRALSPVALASLTSLKIVLNRFPNRHRVDLVHFTPRSYDLQYNSGTSCYLDFDELFGGSTNHASRQCRILPQDQVGPMLALDSTLPARVASLAMLAEWHDAAAFMSSRVGVGSLELALVCDIDPGHEYAFEIAHLAVKPLALFLPLKACHVRLAKTPNRPLQSLARQAVMQAHPSAKPPSLKPANSNISSPLASLPAELRVRILEYTDLVAPWKEVTYSREDRGYLVCHASHEVECPLDDPDMNVDCFCRRRHAAFSVTCSCWAPPTDLFLVSRALCRDAQFVFFSTNRFVVHDSNATRGPHLPSRLPRPPRIPDGDTATSSTVMCFYPFDRFAASEFLRDVVPTHCLAHLCFLELVFPAYEPDVWPHWEHASLQDWRATLFWARSRITAPALTVRIVIGTPKKAYSRQYPHDDQVAKILNGYECILTPLRQLVTGSEGLRALHVQPAHPWRWTREALDVFRRPDDVRLLGERAGEADRGLQERYVRSLLQRNDVSAAAHERGKAEPS
ncbi:hypothetical protein B0T24DRAFT_676724 [Lasiosphaeria ovina]|uniref:F-box domain-containing protein n=1 Tax=Lasiosphaeria ovina TaxID=92902 RepID=A0AAE0KHC1_9PEZI|nr:hypothetical protein B0T24DRAFT_676724 [Lasiosphaeria ovina]